MLHLFKGIESGEISNLPAYSFYAKLSGGLEPQPPISGVTIVLDEERDKDIAQTVVAASRANYAKKYITPLKTKNTRTTKDNKSSEKLDKRDENSSQGDDEGRPG
jgi:hypothetical protein